VSIKRGSTVLESTSDGCLEYWCSYYENSLAQLRVTTSDIWVTTFRYREAEAT